jgi:glucan phosphoethanolaminetransferase (alkaline phosphatase superfamily)
MAVRTKMTPKKFTRWFFYVLGTVAALALLFLIVEFTIRNWNEMRNIVLALVIGLAVAGLFRLGMWAFTPDYNYEKDPFKGPYRSRIFPTPNYFDSEEYGLLSDGRSAIPHYSNSKFIGRFPENPYAGENIGEYTWGKHSSGSWAWLHKDGSK